jgi:histidinol dehydrogenase
MSFLTSDAIIKNVGGNTAMKKKKKDFDCVEMKHKIQEQIYEETKDLSDEELIEYFRKGAERFQREVDEMRKEKKAKRKRRSIE